MNAMAFVLCLASGTQMRRVCCKESLPRMWIHMSTEGLRITSVSDTKVVEDRRRIYHKTRERVLRVARMHQEPPSVLPDAKCLLNEETRGRVTKIKPAAIRSGWGMERIHEEQVAITGPRVTKHEPVRTQPFFRIESERTHEPIFG